MVAVQNLKGEIMQLILSRKGGGVSLSEVTHSSSCNSPLFGYVVHKDLTIGGVMVRMLVDRVVGLINQKLVFIASLLSTQYI